MDRREKVIFQCNLNGAGLEIGPSINPVVPKCDEYNVETIDHTDKNGLLEKYKSQGLNTDKIEEVDYIWNGESYTELTGKKNHYDYIIASHVIEHTCDLIGFFRDCSEILRENGVLSLVIPDKRRCFDYFRPLTSISNVIDRHLNKYTFNSPGSVYEFYSCVCTSDGNIAWDCPTPPVDVKLSYEVTGAINAYNDTLNHNKYIDIHNWVFIKSTFEQIIYELNCLDLIDLTVAQSFDTEGHEFFVSLVKRSKPFIASEDERLKLANKAINELEPTDCDFFYTEQVNGLKDYISKQSEQIEELKEHIEKLIKDQQEQIKGIYNSKTYKTGEKIQKVYRFFKPVKTDN